MSDIELTVGISDAEYSAGMTRIKQSSLKVADAVSRLSREEKKLEKLLGQGLISKETQRRALNRLSRDYDAFERGLLTTNNTFKNYIDAAGRAAMAQTRLQGSTSAATKSMSRSAVMTQQAGYQLGDFIVQVQSGQNAFVAFGQQATQVAGTLTMYGGRMVALGTALGIMIPLATAALAVWSRTRTAANEAANGTKRFEDSLKSAREQVRGMKDDLELMRSGFDNMFEKTLDDQVKLAEAALEAQQAALEEFKVREGIAEISARLTEDQEWRVQVMQELVNKAQAELDAARELVKQKQYENDLREQAVVFANSLNEAQDEAYRKAEETVTKVRELEESLGESVVTALALGGVDLTSNISSAVVEAGKLAAQYNIALAAAIRLQNGDLSVITGTGSGPTSRRGHRRGTTGVAPESSLRPGARSIDSAANFYNPIVVGGGSSGGGGGGGSAQEDRIGALAKSLLTEQETVDLWRDESMEKLKEFNKLELELLGGHSEAKLRLEKEYKEKSEAIIKAERATKVDAFSGMFGDLSSLMQSGNSKLFKIGKAASLANAVVNGYEAATEAWSKGMAVGGPPVAAAFAAASIAKTGSLIASIQSTSIGGGSGGSAGGGSGADAGAISSTSAQEPQRVLIQGLRPDDMFTGQMLSDLFDKFYEENDERGQVFQVSF